MKKLILPIMISTAFALQSCTVMKVSEKQEDGYFQSTKKAVVLVNKPFDLDEHKQLLVVPNSTFMKGMAEKIGYFDRVITFEELESEIIKDGKQDDIGSMSGKIGINNIYRKYKKFLYLRFDDNKEKSKRIQLKLINPENFDEIFVGDTLFDEIWTGVNDQNTFNPLFNSLISYIEEHSKTYKNKK
ncbi:hypothetical protein [Bergeyella zoohelcum]|uniref:DUF4136 domain-containing protein n=1 Tax=Bergeyella zoohelcum ATCC 43767 TaxID=883096 RepID=K1LXV2_9FLAO|nr:hypothetical protein [Bergeyella zoohelcum]EKB56907.1 hypothetical protein HMPREF9699_01190 [Bergeyella zoohelcum ATCC 43767]SUV48629.1 Uncharacterised protein [Bergeyella zoohelcum]